MSLFQYATKRRLAWNMCWPWLINEGNRWREVFPEKYISRIKPANGNNSRFSTSYQTAFINRTVSIAFRLKIHKIFSLKQFFLGKELSVNLHLIYILSFFLFLMGISFLKFYLSWYEMLTSWLWHYFLCAIHFRFCWSW